MAPIKALNKVKLKLEYNKYYKITKKFFSKDGQITNESALVDAIANEVAKDSKVKYVESNFERANQLEYGNIFWGYSNAHDFFKKCSLKTWITKFTGPNNLICGRTASEYENIGCSSEKRGKYWYIWLIGKEIRKRAQIAADGIKKNKQADEDFSPKWQFISTAKMNDAAKATMANAAIEAAAKAAKVSATAKEPQRDEQNGQTQNSTFGNKSKIIPNERSLRNSVTIAERISDEKNKFSLKKSLSRLSFNRTKKSKDDTSEPNQKGFKKLKKLWKSKNSKISPLKISVNDTNYTFNNFEELKKTVINILNKCDELYSKECTNALNEFEGLVTRLKTSYPELRAPSRDTEPVHPALKKYSDIILKAKEGPLYGLNDYIHSKDGSAKSGGFEGALAAVKLMTWDGNNMNKNRLAWKIFNGKNFKYTKKFKFDEEIMKELEKRYEEAGKQYSAYSSDVTALVQYLIQFSGVTETLDEFTLSRIKQLSWYKSQLLVLEKELKISQRKSSMLGVRKNNRQREELKDKADDKRESEKKNIKNENLNQTKKSFSKESRSKIEELMKKSDDGSLQENDRKTLLDLLEHKELSGETLTKKEKTELDNLLHAKGLKTKEEVEALSDDEFLDYLME